MTDLYQTLMSLAIPVLEQGPHFISTFQISSRGLPGLPGTGTVPLGSITDVQVPPLHL